MTSDQIERLLALQTMVREILITAGSADCAGGLDTKVVSSLPTAEAEVARRRMRKEQFAGYGIFSDPAWDILLEVFIAEVAHTRLAVSSLGLDTEIAHATAFRWVGVLDSMGLIKRTQDPEDKRRNWVNLTSEGLRIMRTLFRDDRSV
jgi:DNA-binding MarR family transcriptional regulator